MLASIVVFGLSQGTFNLVDSGTSGERLGLPRLPGRVRGEGAALPVPRLAPRRLHARRRPRSPAMLSGVVSKAAVYGLHLDRARHSSRSRSTTSARSILVLAAIGLVYGSLLAFRAAGHPRRRRVLVDGADEPDRARHLRRRTTSASTARCSSRSATGSSRRRCSCSPAMIEPRTGTERASPSSAGWRAGDRRSRRC